ncbi:MAG: RtcB family protein [Phycisphaerae bacterium]|nr:RtcB family protein [Phycisphaerae bacterium]
MTETPVVRMWVIEPPEPAVRQTIDRLVRSPDVAHVAVMPDVHLAAGVSNGVVVATERFVYPAAVGGDIGCGFAVVAFAGGAAALDQRSAAEAVLRSLPRSVPVMRHRRCEGLPELAGKLAPDALSAPELAAKACTDGRLELGTLGRGNHFLEFQEAEDGCMWLMVHSGSRAMGQHITAYHSQRAVPAGGGLGYLDTQGEFGIAYLRDVAWARAYAAEGRRRMIEAAAALVADSLSMEVDWGSYLNSDHNHVQAERHDGRTRVIQRSTNREAKSRCSHDATEQHLVRSPIAPRHTGVPAERVHWRFTGTATRFM